MIHRIVATSALLLAIYACWRSMKPARLPGVARQAFMLLGLMLLLSMVGIWSSDPRRLLVNFVNLLGGLVLVSMAWRLVQATAHDAGAHEASRPAPLLTMGMAMLGAAVVFGGVLGAR
jgi:heme A synthase